MIFLPRAKFPKTCRLRDPSGFTLVELLVALTILAVGFLGVYSLGIGIIRANLSIDRLTTATTLAQDKLEQIRGLGYSAAASSTENYNSIATYPFYKRVTSVQVGTPAVGMKTVIVTVYWNSDANSVALTNYLAE